MSDEPKKRSRAWIWWAAFAVLLLGHPLSMGPASRWYARDNETVDAGFKAIYAPIFWVCDRSDTVRDVVNWYADVCDPPDNP
jgi:hypothetical protein